MENVSNNNRIAKNTIYLYVRMLFNLVVSLYTSRILLNALGAEDYGINNVVGGSVTMFAFLSGTMATATQRFLSFEIGRGDKVQLRKTFAVSNTLLILLSIIVILCVETLGLWLLNNKLVIPADRMLAAQFGNKAVRLLRDGVGNRAVIKTVVKGMEHLRLVASLQERLNCRIQQRVALILQEADIGTGV